MGLLPAKQPGRPRLSFLCHLTLGPVPYRPFSYLLITLTVWTLLAFAGSPYPRSEGGSSDVKTTDHVPTSFRKQRHLHNQLLGRGQASADPNVGKLNPFANDSSGNELDQLTASLSFFGTSFDRDNASQGRDNNFIATSGVQNYDHSNSHSNHHLRHTQHEETEKDDTELDEEEEEEEDGYANPSADVQGDDLVNSPEANKSAISTGLRWYELVLQARAEAACLQDFGGMPDKVGRGLEVEGMYLPFICPANSSNCEQCRQLTVAKDLKDCEKICSSEKIQDWGCMSRCQHMLQTTLSILEAVTTKPDPGSEESNISSSIFSPRVPREQTLLAVGQRQFSRFEFPAGNRSLDFLDVFCEGVTQHPESSTLSLSDLSSRRGPNSMTASSSYRPSKHKDHFVVLRTHFNFSSSLGFVADEPQSGIYPSSYSDRNPLVFVIEERECLLTENRICLRWSPWDALFKTIYGLNKIFIDYNGGTYQWRVSVVDSIGVVDKLTSAAYTALNGYVEPGVPKKIYVIKNKVVLPSMVSVLIGWDPPEERTCFYKVVLENHDRDEKPRTVRIRHPRGSHRLWFENLDFGTSYEVRITSRSASWNHEAESTHASLTFVTPTCLEVHSYKFSECEPPPPRNVSGSVRIRPSKDTAVADPVVTLSIFWQPPLHASETNRIEKYIVSITSFSFSSLSESNHRSEKLQNSLLFTSTNSSLGFHPGEESLLGPWHVPGNETTLEVEGVAENKNYAIQVLAVSSKGASLPARYTIRTDVASKRISDKRRDEEAGNTQFYTLTFLLVPFLATASLALSCRLLRDYVHKRKIKAARTHYFKSMDEKDRAEEECSVVPLYEEPLSWLELQGNYAKGAFEIEYKDIVLGDVIGQGAFGVVRRATMSSKLYAELWRKQRNSKHRVFHRSYDESEADADVATVAVKMLKVGNTTAERDELIKEIVTMQNLGYHPQIVSLLGACTRGRALGLVLEYCPGGDLLTFLRKFREKYAPLLNMSCQGGKDNSLPRSKGNLVRSPTDVPGNSLCSNEISYANITKFVEPASPKNSPEQPDDTETECDSDTSLCVSNPMYGSGLLECGKLDERQVLSYARQIALGMEYLERNHVVHRDLACRNILMTGDHRCVKISDFGLSRDIYTWNVYHQKTDGKLPVKWMAIESIFSHVFTSKSDVWSFGILLWELVTLGGNPYPGIGNNELFHLLKSGYRMERPENCSEELYALMKKCWRSSPIDRPKFTELSRHLETLLEAGEPNMYLSFQPDIPIGYFSMSELRNEKQETA